MNIPKSGYIDLRPLKEEVDGNITVCQMLINSFITDIDGYINAMNIEVSSYNLPKLYQVAHKIIPSIRIFNIKKLEPIIIQLESELKREENLELINKNIRSEEHTSELQSRP